MAENETSNKAECDAMLAKEPVLFKVTVVELQPFVKPQYGNPRLWELDVRDKELYSQKVDAIDIRKIIDAVNSKGT